jgi:hypothetical protein
MLLVEGGGRASLLMSLSDTESAMLQQRPEATSRRENTAAETQFSERAGTALRAALQGHLRQPVPDHTLRRALHALCIDARARNLRPEQLIVIFKQVWSSLPEIQNRSGNRRQELLDRIVTMCIEEYYATRAD